MNKFINPNISDLELYKIIGEDIYNFRKVPAVKSFQRKYKAIQFLPSLSYKELQELIDDYPNIISLKKAVLEHVDLNNKDFYDKLDKNLIYSINTYVDFVINDLHRIFLNVGDDLRPKFENFMMLYKDLYNYNLFEDVVDDLPDFDTFYEMIPKLEGVRNVLFKLEQIACSLFHKVCKELNKSKL